jgi:SNF2 family DNA or RNA helicase
LTQIQPSVHSVRWIDCCHLFQFDPQEVGLDERVKLAGLRTSLYQYQAYGVYWQMKTSRAVGGGFVADEMGLGKTLSFLAYIVAERQLSWLWQDVEAARAIDHPRHLKETGQYPGARCPSRDERRGWITCPCASSSPTSQWPAKGGVRLACVPQSLIPTWAKQWNEHVNEREVNLGMRLVIAHDSSNSIPAPGFGNVDARHARNIKELSAKRNIFDSKASAYLDDTAKPNQDRYLVLTTTQSYKKWVKRFEYTGQFVSSVNSAEKLTWVNGKGRGIVFGLAMIDECHEEFSKEKGHAGVLSNIPLTNNPFIWGYSGTPILNTPRSIEGVLSAIEQHFPRIDKYSKVTGWEQDQTLSQYRHNNFDLICKDFEKHIKNKTGNLRAARHIEKALASFLARFMIRRTAESTWFGRPLIELKKHIHQDVFLAHNPKYDDKLVDLIAVIKDEAREKFNDIRATLKVNDPLCQQASFPTSLTFNQICRVEWRLRIIASFPFLVTLASVNHKHHLNLTTEEAIKYNGTQLTKSPYFTYLRQITNSSSKCIWLHHYITELLQTIDVEMKEQKLVIMTQFNPVALILKLVCFPIAVSILSDKI